MTAVPTTFWKIFEHEYGTAEAKELAQALNGTAPITLRLHPQKARLSPGNSYPRVPWCQQGIYLNERPPFIADPHWHSGSYYVQEASSMAIGLYLKTLDYQPQVALDLCAAPGGKSTLLRDNLPAQCVLIANEPNTERSNILAENMLRHGGGETIVTRAMPQQLLQSGLRADFILVDAPCSGEGMFRKYLYSREEWSEQAVTHCAQRQHEILDVAWEMLQPGGVLVYSTCTFNTTENEAQWLYLKNKGAELLELPNVNTLIPGVLEKERGVYHLLPHRLSGEGLSMFAVRKGGSRPPITLLSPPKKLGPLPPQLKQVAEQFRITLLNEQFTAATTTAEAVYQLLLRGRVRILHAGVALGELKNKDFFPHHNWLTNALLNKLLPYPLVEVADADALTFLSRGVVRQPAERGFLALTHQGALLGWGKGVGSRINNLYPKGLCIKCALTTNNIHNYPLLELL